jgi:hypothetical protein
MRAAVTLAALLMMQPLVANASARSGAYSLELIDGSGNVLPTYMKGGRTYILGVQGQRYSLRIRNGSGQRVEFVASVDGRDVLDGSPAAVENRGYIVEPYREVVIDGFRLNNESVAAFRFSSVRNSYAGRMGDARDVGVIGVAVFSERPPVYVPPPQPQVSLWDRMDRSLSGLGSAGTGGPIPPQAADKDSVASSPAPSAGEPTAKLERKAAQERPGLGTEFGEQRTSHAFQTQFERASSRPNSVLTLRYDDRAGLIAMGIDVDRNCDTRVRETAEPFRHSFSQPPPGWSGR